MSKQRQLNRLLADVGEVLAAREPEESYDFAEYAPDPVSFIVDVIEDDPWQKQIDIAEAVAREPQVTVRSCHAAGKDWLSARLALWWTYAHEGLCILTGPTGSQVQEVLMRTEVRRAFADSGLPGRLGVKALRPEGEGEAGILARTSSDVSNLTGHHRDRVMVIITEAQAQATAPAWRAAFALATGAADRIVALGNPTRSSGRFYRSHRPDSGWAAYRIQGRDIPNVKEGREVVPGLLSRAGVTRFRHEYGEESPVYQSRVDAEFPDQVDPSAIFTRSMLEAAVRRYRDGAVEPGTVVLGLDVAGTGPNESILAVRRGLVLDELIALPGSDTTDLISEVRAAMAERNLGKETPLIVDSTGLGTFVADRLRQLRHRAVNFRAGAQAANPQQFRNLRAESYWRVRLLLDRNRLALCPSEKLAEELLAQRLKQTGDSAMLLEPKHQISSRLGRSPDRADAAVMALYPPTPDEHATVEPHETPSYETEQSGSFLPRGLNAGV